MSTESKQSGAKKRNASIWVKAFVVLHLVSITMWTLPDPKKPYKQGTVEFGIDSSSPQKAVQSFSETVTEGFLYLNWKYLKPSPLIYYPGITGFWQMWDMFSPNPSNTDLYLEADVEYKDGSKLHFCFPRMYKLSIPMKYLKERYRKYYENANSDDQKFAWPYLADRIALECFKDRSNPPLKVSLTRFWYPIAAPGQRQLKDYNVTTYFVGLIDQQRLFRSAGFNK